MRIDMTVQAQEQLFVAAVALLSVLGGVEGVKCQPGVMLPIWKPQEITRGEIAMRGAVYFLAMLYMFLGVSIVSDRFMGAIEVITSKEREVRISRPGGDVQIVVVRVWNETVANLTLMALGSSAPEILLSIIEVTGKLIKQEFENGSGELGPSTIVGSAAFNLLIIIAICVYVIPDGEIRRIRHLRVFIVTAIWSLFAYVWLFFILKVFSPGVVEIWEGLVTFFCFPLTVITAYMADREILIHKYLTKSFRVGKRGTIVGSEGGDDHDHDGLKVFEEEETNTKIRDFEENRREYIGILRDLRKKFPNTNADQLEQLAREEIYMKGQKSRAFYRLLAARKYFSGHRLPRKPGSFDEGRPHSPEEPVDPFITNLFFDPGHYTVMESVGLFNVTVKRRGGDLDSVVMVDYKNEDGTALAGSDYKALHGTLTFTPGEIEKTIPVEILQDEVFEEDEHFYIRLSRPRFYQKPGRASAPFDVQLDNPFLATVMILDDDHAGIFNVNDKEIETVESIGILEVQINRWSGARGKVSIDFATVDGTAKKGKEYEHVEGKLIFDDGEVEKKVSIPIIEEDTYEKDVVFFLQISHAVSLDVNGVPIPIPRKNRALMTKEEIIAMEGWPKIGPDGRTNIRIRESKEFKDTIDKLLQKANARILAGTSSWKEQFIEAFTVNPDNDDNDDESDVEAVEVGDSSLPSMGDYLMHFLTLFWKVLFAFVPPTDICGGYLTFFVSILMIGILTAVIGDLAAHFGCTVHLKDSVTAITFVALGTSIPDTFASKVAAIQDQFADASIGNVTGSNAVNVFLGIGIAWTIAAITYACRKCTPTTPDCNKFKVDPGSLAFSVTLFCTCAVIAISVILVRRLQVFGGGELGGPRRFKLPTTLLFVALWLFYIFMSSLEVYGVFRGF